MICPYCRTSLPDDTKNCTQCGGDMVAYYQGETMMGGSAAAPSAAPEPPHPSAATGVATPTPTPTPSPSPSGRTPSSSSPPGSSSIFGFALTPGADFGPRYHIEAILGEGGMGAVYKAFDRDLDRTVAIKLLRPGLMADPVAIQRFKQELLLASKISHKNILRIHDLGDVDGVKFISMAFVAGEDLHRIIRRSGRLPLDRALKMARQLCGALEAAHAEGVVHRDLKPQNVLVDTADNAYITDFGLAKSLEAGAAGMTRAGEYLGTPRYMSPEQVEGKPIDNRSDLYSLGLILYEMLTGDIPFTSDSTLQLMFQRVKQKPKDPRELNPEIPEYLARVILRCLEKDPKHRYQHSREILKDLETEHASAARSLSITLPMPETKKGWLLFGGIGAAALVLLVLAFPLLRGVISRISGPAAPAELAPVSLLIADFENKTGEEVFSGTLEPALSIALEGASFINSYRRSDARKLAEQIHEGPTPLTQELARLVATREGVHVVVGGSVETQDGKYALTVRAVDAVTGKEIASQQATAGSKEEVLPTVSRLAARLRSALGDRTPESAQLAEAETYTTGSLEAAQAYAQAQELQWAGQWEPAIAQYRRALELDPEMGRAYAGLAVVSNNMGRAEDAERYYQQALSKIDRMSEREKYRTRGTYYVFKQNYEKAVEELSELVRLYPADTAGNMMLAVAYFFKQDIPQAFAQARRVVELNPGNVPNRNNLGLMALYAGDFEASIAEQRKVLEMNPTFEGGHIGLALALYAQGQLEDAAAAYRKLSEFSPRGASVAAAGLADIALYEGRAADAIALLEKGLAEDQKNDNRGAMAHKLVMLADAYRLAGKPAQAVDAADRALAAARSMPVLFWSGWTHLALDRDAKALAVQKELGQRFEPMPQAYAKILEGEAELRRGRAVEAIKSFQESRRYGDTWMGRYALGRAYLEAGLFAEAGSEFDNCLKRKGEIISAFFDSRVPTYRLFPTLHYYIGRAHEGLKSPAAPESYKAFLDIKKNGAQDPLVVDARKRLAAR